MIEHPPIQKSDVLMVKAVITTEADAVGCDF